MVNPPSERYTGIAIVVDDWLLLPYENVKYMLRTANKVRARVAPDGAYMYILRCGTDLPTDGNPTLVVHILGLYI